VSQLFARTLRLCSYGAATSTAKIAKEKKMYTRTRALARRRKGSITFFIVVIIAAVVIGSGEFSNTLD
jgi:hypothetical protein